MSASKKYLLASCVLAGFLTACGGGGGGSPTQPNFQPDKENPPPLVNNLHNLLYIGTLNSNEPVLLCQFNTSGATSCKNSGAQLNSGLANFAQGIVINQAKTFAYVSAENSTIYRCAINQTDGTLSACTPFEVPGLGTTRSGAINGSTIYFGSVFNSAIYKCTIGQDGGLSACSETYQNSTVLPPAVEAITFKNSTTLMVNTNAGIRQCLVDTDGSISQCSDAGYDYPTFENVRGLQYNLDKSKLYIIGTSPTVDDANIIMCSNSDPLSNCNSAWSNPSNPGIPDVINPDPSNPDSSDDVRVWVSDMAFTLHNYAFVSTATYSYPGGNLLRTSTLYACQIDPVSNNLTGCTEQLQGVVPSVSINRMAILN